MGDGNGAGGGGGGNGAGVGSGNEDEEGDEDDDGEKSEVSSSSSGADEVEIEDEHLSEDQHLERLLQAGPPSCPSVHQAAGDLIKAKKAYVQAKQVRRDATPDDEEAASEDQGKKLELWNIANKFYKDTLEWRNKAAALNKATEFKFMGRERHLYFFEFRETPGGPSATRMTVTEARGWFEWSHLKTALRFPGWVPLENIFTHLQVDYSEETKEFQYTVFKGNGIGVPVPHSWIELHFPEGAAAEFVGQCETEQLGKKTHIPEGAAAHSGSGARTPSGHVTAAVVSCSQGVRNPLPKAPDGSGSRLSTCAPDLQYPQGSNDYCAFYGLASALHFAGQVHKAEKLASAASVSKNFDKMAACAEKCRQLFGKDHEVLKMDISDRCSPLLFYPKFFYNIQIEDSHGFPRHCIAIHQNLIFDSNLLEPMHLTKEGLDLCCSTLRSGESFARVRRGYCLQPKGPR